MRKCSRNWNCGRLRTHLFFLGVDEEKLADELPTSGGNSGVELQSGTIRLIEMLEGGLLVHEFPRNLNYENWLAG
jgi:hypothetical protein